MPETDPTTTIVTTLLSRAGLHPSTAELDALVAAYRAQAAGIEALWALPEARYESLALRFAAAPVFADWSPK